ncbi:nuclear transport factor 2 family protein [Paenibacillus sp. NPDC058071]|uniref:nuclear transport factor 2 family protein n=1 Tax=Paenibacillus sp. NPDC058071 TaxID=3346326 RepID=UPI0036D7CEE2
MIKIPESVAVYFNSVNDREPEAFLAAFDEHAYVLDMKREFIGKEAISSWSKSELFEPKVQFAITDAREQDNSFIVTVSIDGEFDKTNLPDPFLMKHRFMLDNGKIKELHISFT